MAGRLRAGQRVRLPTEAEWEAAARGGLRASEKSLRTEPVTPRRYPWDGDITPNHANYSASGIGSTSAVGAFSLGISEYGCEEQAGNVWEWCSTKSRKNYDGYAPDEDPEGDDWRVLRGGAYGSDGWFARCASRDWYPPGFCNFYVGFRVVVSPSFSSL